MYNPVFFTISAGHGHFDLRADPRGAGRKISSPGFSTSVSSSHWRCGGFSNDEKGRTWDVTMKLGTLIHILFIYIYIMGI